MQRAAQQAAAAGNFTGYGVYRGGFCLLGGWLRTGEELQYQLEFEGGKSYLIVAAGDADVKDLDLSVTDGSTTVEDAEEDNTPWVHFSAESDVEVTITLKNFKGSSAPDFCALIILESDGGGAKLDRLVQAANGLVEVVGAVGGEWSTDTGNWCLVGGLFESGGGDGIMRTFSPGTYVLVGFGDSACKDLDASVTDEDDNPVAKDEATDSTPVVPFQVEGEEVTGTLSLKMFDAEGSAFGVAIVLKRK